MRVWFVGLLLLALLNPAFADVPRLDEVELIFRTDGTFMQDEALTNVAKIRQLGATDQPVPSSNLASVITHLRFESEQEMTTQPARALKKLDMALRLVEEWNSSWIDRETLIRAYKGVLLMRRWFLRQDPDDLVAARKAYAELDELELRPEKKGVGAYYLGASYKHLASYAGTVGRPREEQIALINAGIAANKAGRARQPSQRPLARIASNAARLLDVCGVSLRTQAYGCGRHQGGVAR